VSTWTTNKPTTPGDYWLSFPPERRPNCFRPVIRCNVFASPFDEPEQLRVRLSDSDYRSMSESCFAVAQWRPVEEVPADPFAVRPPNNSRDSDLP